MISRGDQVTFIGRKRVHIVRAVRPRGNGTRWIKLRGPNRDFPRKKPVFDWYPSEEFALAP